jgi:hypothetical protein
MTESELENVRLRVQQEVLLLLVRGLYTGLANSSPASAASLLETFASLRKDHQRIVLKGMNPAYSDLLSAEYQEALESSLSYIESGIGR